jgi:hypothetical protein
MILGIMILGTMIPGIVPITMEDGIQWDGV